MSEHLVNVETKTKDSDWQTLDQNQDNIYSVIQNDVFLEKANLSPHEKKENNENNNKPKKIFSIGNLKQQTNSNSNSQAQNSEKEKEKEKDKELFNQTFINHTHNNPFLSSIGFSPEISGKSINIYGGDLIANLSGYEKLDIALIRGVPPQGKHYLEFICPFSCQDIYFGMISLKEEKNCFKSLSIKRLNFKLQNVLNNNKKKGWYGD